MSGYVRELLRDQSLYNQEDMEAGSEDHITRIDLQYTLQQLLERGILDRRHILALNAYYIGDYHLRGIPGVTELLAYALVQIENHADIPYTDAFFIRRAIKTRYPKWTTIEHALIGKLMKYGATFDELA